MTLVDELAHVLERTCERVRSPFRGERYVQRLACREDSDPAVARAGRSRQLSPGQDVLLTEEDLARPGRRIALLGGAGSGKSFVLREAYTAAASRFTPEAPVPFFLDLDGELDSRNDFAASLDAEHGGLFSRVLREHSPGCMLFLDSLDDRMLLSARLVTDLRHFLNRHERALAGMIIACRRSAYSPDWFRSPGPVLETFHVDHLGDEEYEQILDPGQLDSFRRECDRIGIYHLLARPFDGFYLARRFARGEELPRSRLRCLDERTREALAGTHADRSRGESVPVDRLLELARLLACVATFAGRTHWSVQEAIDLLGSSRVLRERGGPGPDEVRQLLQRPLFHRAGDRFSFDHQLYREYLAAEALRGLPLSKQLQLVGTSHPGSRRIATPYRGIAGFLAGLSSEFAAELIAVDPLAAMLTEETMLPTARVEELLERLFETARAERRFPWWQVPPRGESLNSVLWRFRPERPEAFLRPKLASDDLTTRMWAASAAASWGGVRGVNDLLTRIALDAAEHTSLRSYAIEAVAKSGDVAACQRLEPLATDRDDSVRADGLELYRKTANPPPRSYFEKLRGGAGCGAYVSALPIEVREYCRGLPGDVLTEAIELLEDSNLDLGNLRRWAIDGVVERAYEFGFADVPPELVLEALAKLSDLDIEQRPPVVALLESQPSILGRIWQQQLDAARSGGPGPYRANLDRLVQISGTGLLQFLPANPSGEELLFVRRVLRLRVYRDRATKPEWIARIREWADHLVDPQWRLPDRRRVAPVDDLEIRARLVGALNDQIPARRAMRILRLAAPENSGPTLESTERFLASLPAYLARRVIEAFRECVGTVTYRRQAEDELAIPFWILWGLGEAIATEKLRELAACYAGDPMPQPERDRWKRALDALRSRSLEDWRGAVSELFDQGNGPARFALTLASNAGDGFLTDRIRDSLVTGAVDPNVLNDVLSYWSRLARSDRDEVLWACYEAVAAAGDGPREPWPRRDIQVLLALMSNGDASAWSTFDRRRNSGEIPAQIDHAMLKQLRGELPGDHVRILADWYRDQRRSASEESWDDLGRFVLGTIERHGGVAGIRELRRIRDESDLRTAAGASAAALRIEDALLAQTPAHGPAGTIIDAILEEQLEILRDERDLYFALCRAIREIEADHARGEGVAGYWDLDEPKHEALCQNVLWPRLRDKLNRYGVVGIEERVVGPDRADFWVAFPRPRSTPIEVAVELKVARSGYGEAELVRPIRDQLYGQYLEPTGCRHGIFVVLWFRDDRYPHPARWIQPDQLRAAIEVERQITERDFGVTLDAFVLDLTAQYRSR